jgi:hypothetical protein
MKVSMDMDVAPNPNSPDIHISTGLHTIYIIIIILDHLSLLAIIIWKMEGRGSGGHGRGRFDCLVCLAGSK